MWKKKIAITDFYTNIDMTQSWWLSKKAQPLLRNVAQAFCLMSQVTSSSRFFLIYCFRFELRKFIYSIRVVGTVKARPYINEDLMVLIDPVDFMDLIMDPNVLQWLIEPMHPWAGNFWTYIFSRNVPDGGAGACRTISTQPLPPHVLPIPLFKPQLWLCHFHWKKEFPLLK